MNSKCEYCVYLSQSKFSENLFRCVKGHFDLSCGPDWFTWGGIIKPNKTVLRLNTTCQDHKFKTEGSI